VDGTAAMKPTLKSAADYHRMVLDSLEEGYCVLEMILDAAGRPTDYRFVDTNPAFERHTGLIDAVGRTARELVPELEDQWVEIYGRVALSGTAERFTQGSEAMGRWFEVEAFRVGEPEELRVALLFHDVSERRRADQARRAADERLRAIFENIEDYAIYATDPQGRVTEWTLGAERIKGYRADEVIGRTVDMFYADEDRRLGTPRQELDEAARSGRSERQGWKVRRNGERFWAAETTTAMRGPDGQLTGYTRITHDLTEQRAIEHARQEQFERERQAREDAEAFLGLLSHELRTPVTSIFGNASLIARDPERANVRELVRDVQEEADRLVRLIDDLLMLSRVDRGLIQLEPEPLLLQHVFPQVIADVRRRGLEARFELDLPTFLPPVVADATALRQVLYNLFSNAAKYAGAAGPVAIRAKQEQSTVEVSVEDHGPGLGADPEQLFTLYYRDPQTARLATGTGVGLYVARELMEAMSGTIDARTRDGGGASFRITIPQAHEDDADRVAR
jgi:PAS domain S-box-containing protein